MRRRKRWAAVRKAAPERLVSPHPALEVWFRRQPVRLLEIAGPVGGDEVRDRIGAMEYPGNEVIDVREFLQFIAAIEADSILQFGKQIDILSNRLAPSAEHETLDVLRLPEQIKILRELSNHRDPSIAGEARDERVGLAQAMGNTWIENDRAIFQTMLV